MIFDVDSVRIALFWFIILPRVWSDYRRDFWIIEFIDLLHFVTTNNYNTIAISILYQMFVARSVFGSRCLVAASNDGYSSASMLKSSLNCGSLQSASVKVKVSVTLRLAVYRQSVRHGVKPFETHDQSFFFHLNPCGHSSHVTFSLTGRCHGPPQKTSFTTVPLFLHVDALLWRNVCLGLLPSNGFDIFAYLAVFA
jgi:hypothetical protein